MLERDDSSFPNKMSFIIVDALPAFLGYMGFDSFLTNVWVTAAGIGEQIVQGRITDYYAQSKRRKLTHDGRPEILGSGTDVIGSRVSRITRIEDITDIPELLSPIKSMSDNAAVMVKDFIEVGKAKHEVVGGPVNHYRVDNFTGVSAEGRESNLVVGTMGTKSHWDTNTPGSNTQATTAVAWLDLNPAQGRPEGMRYVDSQRPQDDALLLEYITQIFEFVNLGNTPAFCELTAYKCKNHTADTVVTNIGTAFTSLIAPPDADLAFPAAAVAPTGALNFGAANIQLPWGTKYPPVSVVTSNYGKLKCWPFQLPAGGRLVLKVGVKMNMLGNRTDLADSGQYVKGSLQYLFSNFGSAVQTTATGSAEGKIVHSSSKVGCIVTSMLKFRTLLAHEGPRDKRYTAFYNVAANNAIGAEEFMDTDINAESIVKHTT